ncbi:heavy metal transporter [Sulfolobus acidocaldarius SUSAZ]|nr:heavy metal transporter [Sulfolobus acidocaldarius SUSAZ]
MDEFNKKEINNELRVMKFQVFDVECGNCVYKIKRALATLPNVVDINITPDFDNSKAVVILRYKGNLDKREIEEILKEISEESPYHEYKAVWES